MDGNATSHERDTRRAHAALADGVGERVARIPVEKGALVGAAAKVASDTMRDEARAAKADAKRAKAGKK